MSRWGEPATSERVRRMSTLLDVIATLVWLGAGYAAARHLFQRRTVTLVEQAALAGGLGLIVLAAATLVGTLPRPAIIAVAITLAVVVPVLLYRSYRTLFDEARSPGAAPTPTETQDLSASLSHWPAIALVIALAALFRFVNLGYSEFQGDEARAVMMAHEMVRTRSPEILLQHKKGPLEIVLPAATLRWGDLRESTARLPFAIAGFLGVLAILALGTRLWGFRAGFAAAVALAIDGYLIAFSRIVQYQSLVFLFSVLAVWCAWRFYRRAADGDRALLIAALCIGFGTWAHYEMVFAAPPVAWLALARGREEKWGAREWLRRLLPPAFVAAAVVALFYVPFVRNPQFAETRQYILERRVGSPPFYMLGDFFQRASFYNASYTVVLMATALVAALAARLRGAWGRAGTALGAVWLLAFAVLIARPELFAIGPADAEPRRSLAILVFLPVFLALFVAPRIDAPWRAILLWLAGPFFAASFLVQKPHTHFYTMLPAWALLAGWGADRGLAWLEARRDRGQRAVGAIARAAPSAGALILALLALYPYTVFVSHDPEYKRVYPDARLPGYWMPFGDDPPRGGYFGFPYRAGWNTVRVLFESGRLSGDYDSNEESLITNWYTSGAPRCARGVDGAGPRYYLVAWRPQDAEDIPLDMIERDYHLNAVITVNGQEKLRVWDREPVAGAPLRLEDGVSTADAGLSIVAGREGPVLWPVAECAE